MKENDISTIYKMCIKALNNKPDQDHKVLISTLSALNGFNLSNIEIDTILNMIESYLSTSHAKAHILEDRDQKVDPWLHKILPEEFYHDRYMKYLAESAGFSQSSVLNIDATNREILNRLGNPNTDQPFKRQGLIVGNVQSGKTANYLSLLNLAADYGYKIIILIAGVHNNLRTQTQERINEGFIGLDSEAKVYVGVGEHLPYDEEAKKLIDSNLPHCLTTKGYDFDKKLFKANTLTPDNAKNPIIMVIKKNSSTLKNVINWLRNDAEGQRFIKHPALIIDDEADNASINTKKHPNETTKINGQIREIFNLFKQGSFVGFTATPFANIFIDPEKYDEKLLADDLFPRHFIFSLEAPSNYLGATEFFLDKEGELNYQSDLIDFIDDNEDLLPLDKRPVNFIPAELPSSLVFAIYDFLISIVIKKVRPIKNPHTSMLVNVSHKTEFQRNIVDLIRVKLEEIKRSIMYDGSLPLPKRLENEHLTNIYDKYQKFANEINEEDFFRSLQQICPGVVIKLINSGSKDRLNYKDHKDGLNVIAVGGYSLSRGFTLEGLTISYLIRNTAMSDTLLQMGRWFGYRDGYRDLCKLFIPKKSFEWYGFIAQSLNELKDEFIIMEQRHLTPLEYGLKVRTSKAGLLVTARNKMYNTKNILLSENLSSSDFSLRSLSTSTPDIQRNLYLEFIKQLDLKQAYDHENKSFSEDFLIAQDVNFEVIKSFLEQDIYGELDISKNTKIDRKSMLINYIEAREKELNHWDVLVYHSYTKDNIKNQTRALAQENFEDHFIRIMDGGGRITRPWEEAFGLTSEQYETADQEKKKNNIKQTARFFRKNRTKPLLILKLFDIYSLTNNAEGKNEKNLKYTNIPAFSISFPKSKNESLVSYTCNTVYLEQLFGEDDSEEDEQDKG